MQRSSRNYTFYMHKHICLRSWMTKLTWQALFHGPNLQDLKPWNAKIQVICVCVWIIPFSRQPLWPKPKCEPQIFSKSSQLMHLFKHSSPCRSCTIPYSSTQFHSPTPANPYSMIISANPWSSRYLSPDPRRESHPGYLKDNWKATGRMLFFPKRKTYRGTHVANAGCQPLRCSFHLLWPRSCNISAGGCIFFEKYEFIHDHPIKTYKNI